MLYNLIFLLKSQKPGKNIITAVINKIEPQREFTNRLQMCSKNHAYKFCFVIKMSYLDEFSNKKIKISWALAGKEIKS